MDTGRVAMAGLDAAGARSICVVDDDAAVRHALATLFEACGHACQAFDCAEALLAWPRLDQFRLGVFDVRLPGIDGFALHERLSQLRPDLRVILISGEFDPDTRERAQRAGALALLRKPLDPALLLEHVERALDGPGAAP